MANTFTISSQSYQGRYLKLTCTQTKNQSKNSSTINWVLKVIGGSSTYYSTGPTVVKIGGKTVCDIGRKSYTTESFPTKKNGEKSGEVTINHDNEGKKTIEVSISTAIYSATTQTKSNKWVLDSIPRFATLSNPQNFTDETQPTVSYSNPAGSSAKVWIGVFWDKNLKDPLINYTQVTGTSGTKNFSLNNNQKTAIYNKLTTKRSLPIYYGIKTQIGSTIKTTPSIEKTVYINKDYKPTISECVWVKGIYDKNSNQFTEIKDDYKLLQSEYALKLIVTGTAKKGAELNVCQVNGKQIDYNAKNKQFVCVLTPPLSEKYNIIITDTRDESSQELIEGPDNFIPYFKPYINAKVFTSIASSQTSIASIATIDDDDDDNDTGDQENTVLSAEQAGAIDVSVDLYYYKNSIKTNSTQSNQFNIKAELFEAGETRTAKITLDEITITDSSGTNKVLQFISTEKYIIAVGTYYDIKLTYGDLKNTNNIEIIRNVRIGPIFDWGENDFSFYTSVKYPMQKWTALDMWSNNTSLNQSFCVYGAKSNDKSDRTDPNKYPNLQLNVPQFTVQGNLVTVRGRITVHTALSDYSTNNNFYSNYWFASGAPKPSVASYCLCQGSNGSFWLLTISTGGLLGFSRFRDSSLSVNNNGPTPSTNSTYGEWLIFDHTYSIAGVPQ